MRNFLESVSPNVLPSPGGIGTFLETVAPSPINTQVEVFPSRPAVPSAGNALEVRKPGIVAPTKDIVATPEHVQSAVTNQEVVSFPTAKPDASATKPASVSVFPARGSEARAQKKTQPSAASDALLLLDMSLSRRRKPEQEEYIREKEALPSEVNRRVVEDSPEPADSSVPEDIPISPSRDIDLVSPPPRARPTKPVAAVAPASRPPIEIVDGRWIINQDTFFAS